MLVVLKMEMLQIVQLTELCLSVADPQYRQVARENRRLHVNEASMTLKDIRPRMSGTVAAVGLSERGLQ